MSDKTNSTPTAARLQGKLKEQALNASERVMGWTLLAPGELVRWAHGLSRPALAWGSLALASLLFVTANLSAGLLFRNVKSDLTEDRLYTISQSTKRMLGKLEEPINVRVYYSHRLGEVAPLYGRHFERVKGLLEQYRDLSNGKLKVTFLDPEPFSDAEDRAAAAGLKGQRLNREGETAYFGLVASNTTDNDAVVPFFTPERERFLEYDLTKLIHGLANPKKRVVGLIAGIEMDGGQNPMNPRAQPQPPWMIMEQIRDFFEVRRLDATIKEVPKDIDVLMIAQPTLLSADAAYAIDQYALAGGRVLAFVDPVSESTPMGPMSMGSLPVASDFMKVLKAWGLTFDNDKIVGDKNISRSVQFGGGPGGQPIITEYLAWLQIEKGQLNEKDPLAASIRRLNLATAGSLTKVDGATTIIQPLITTTAGAGLIEAAKVRFRPDPRQIINAFKEGGTPLMLAARIGGEAKTAFPEGRPKAEDKDKKADGATADDKAAAATKSEPAKDAKGEAAKDAKAAAPAKDGKAEAAKAADAKAGETKADAEKAKAAEPAKPDKNHLASGRVNVVVVGDSDMLNDNFWVEVRDFLGQQVAIPQADNAGFVVNALENLSGGEALADLRGRGVVERPFERVTDIRREAELRFRQKEQALNAKLGDLQTKLAKVETRGGEGGGPVTAILTDAEKQAIEKFRSEMITVRRELRDVKAALRRDIDRLDGWLKFFNIAAVPLLIGLGGLGIGFLARRRKTGA